MARILLSVNKIVCLETLTKIFFCSDLINLQISTVSFYLRVFSCYYEYFKTCFEFFSFFLVIPIFFSRSDKIIKKYPKFRFEKK